MIYLKKNAKAIFVIIGTIIGAGFASGQEIYSFFNIYGENGILGLMISSILLGIIIYSVLKKVSYNNITSYGELMEKCKISKRISSILGIIINIFLLLSFYIMVAGFTAYFKQEYGLDNILVTIILLIFCYITFMGNIKGLAKVNTIIVPILIILIIILGIRTNAMYTLQNVDTENIGISFDWIIRAISYASYNSILLIPILIELREYTRQKERIVGIISASIFLIMAITIYLIMFKADNIANIELPLVYIASGFGGTSKLVYGILVSMAIYTTMISAGYGFLQNCTKDPKKYKILALIICLTAIPICYLSFSKLVNRAYPIFGILGLIQLILILRNT